jgi:hypothetical protein
MLKSLAQFDVRRVRKLWPEERISSTMYSIVVERFHLLIWNSSSHHCLCLAYLLLKRTSYSKMTIFPKKRTTGMRTVKGDTRILDSLEIESTRNLEWEISWENLIKNLSLRSLESHLNQDSQTMTFIHLSFLGIPRQKKHSFLSLEFAISGRQADVLIDSLYSDASVLQSYFLPQSKVTSKMDYRCKRKYASFLDVRSRIVMWENVSYEHTQLS